MILMKFDDKINMTHDAKTTGHVKSRVQGWSHLSDLSVSEPQAQDSRSQALEGMSK
jgi:hypothetical protein